MPTIRLPHLAHGSIDLDGARVPVTDHLITVPLDQVGTVLRACDGAELVPDVTPAEPKED